MNERKSSARLLAATAALTALLITSCDLIPGGEEPAEDQPDDAQQGGAGEGGEDGDAADGGAAGPDDDLSADGSAQEEAFASAEISDPAGNSVGEAHFSSAGEAGVLVDVELWDQNPGFRAMTIHEAGVCEPQSYNEAGEFGDYYSSEGVLPGTGGGETGVVEGEDELETEGPEEGEESLEDAGPDGVDNGEGTVPDGSGPSLDDYPEGTLQGRPAANITQPGAEPEEEDEQILHPERAGDLPNIFVMESGDAQMSFVSDRLSEELLTSGDGTSIILRGVPTHHGHLPERYAPYGPDQISQATGDLGPRTACGVIE